MANPLITMTTTMQQLADQLRLYSKLQQYFGVAGVTGQPMSGIANRVMQKLFTKRMPWTFNAEDMSPFPYGSGNFLVTQAGFQQMKFAGASVFVILPANGGSFPINLPQGGCGIDLASSTRGNFTYQPVNGGTNSVSIDPTTGIISVQTLDPIPFDSANIGGPGAIISGVVNPAFNSVYTYNSTVGTAEWTQTFPFVAIQGAHNFTVQGTQGAQYGSLTNVSVSGSTTTVSVVNTMSQGDLMTFSTVVTNTGLNGTTVTLIATTPTTVSFATPTGVTITPGADTGYIYAAPSGAAGIFNFGWLQSSDIYDIGNTSFPMPVDQLKAVTRKAKEYTVTGDRWEIALLVDHNNGVLTFRLTEPPGNYPWAISLTYQKRAPVMSKPGDVFPWPDELSYVLFEMCLHEGMRFTSGNSAEEVQIQGQLAFAALNSALESQDRTDSTMGISPDIAFMSGSGGNGGW